MTAANWSAVLVYLRMHGIPHALGWSTYLSVWREVGTLCMERLAVFVPSLPPSAFHCISVWRVPVFSWVWGLMAPGWVVRFCQLSVQFPPQSWLPIVEAPGCLGHPTSTEQQSSLIVMISSDKLYLNVKENSSPVPPVILTWQYFDSSEDNGLNFTTA